MRCLSAFQVRTTRAASNRAITPKMIDGRIGKGRGDVCAAAGCTLKTGECAANEVQRDGSVTSFSV